MPVIRHDDTTLRLIKDVNDIRVALRNISGSNFPLYDIQNENTPAQITADQNNYVIGNYDVIRLSSSKLVTISGFNRGVKGRSVRVFNIGSYPIILTHQDANSTAEYRFLISTNNNLVILPGADVTLYYNSAVSRWLGTDNISVGVSVLGNGVGTVNDIPDGAATTITFDHPTQQINYDEAGYFNVATPNILTVPPGLTGVHLIGIGGIWESSWVGTGELWISIDGVDAFSPLQSIDASIVGSTLTQPVQSAVYERKLTEGGVIRLRTRQDSGGLLELQFAYIWMRRRPTRT